MMEKLPIAYIPGQEPPRFHSPLIDKVVAEQKQESAERTIDVQSDSEEDLIARARDDFLLFAVLVDNFPVAPIHIERDEFIQKHQRAVLVGPQGHGKTSLESILRPVWMLGCDPNLRIKIVTISDSKACDINQCIKDLIERPSPVMKQIFPKLRPDPNGVWSAHKLTVRRTKRLRDVSIEAVGILSSPTGGRADVIIFDDILDFNNTIKAPSMKTLIRQAFYNVYMKLLEPNGKVIYISTPWTDDDLTAELRESPKWPTLVQAIPEDFTPLWPQAKDDEGRQKWTREELISRYEDGPREFNRAYRAIPLVTLKDRRIALDMPDISMGRMSPELLYAEAKERCTVCIGGVDLSSRSKTVSYTAIVIIGIDEEASPPMFYLLDVRRDRFDQLAMIEELVDAWKKWTPELFFVESNGTQSLILEWLQIASDGGLLDFPELQELVFEPIYTSGDKYSMDIGLPALANLFRQARFKFPYFKDHGKDCDCGICVWQQEVSDPNGAISNDTLMATWFCYKGYRKYGSDINIGELVLF
jgi:hypothetical protein